MNKQLFVLLLFLILSKYSFGQKTILWKITDTISHKTSTIVGTFHQFGNSFVDSIPEIRESLHQSELAIFEAIDDVIDTRKMINAREKSLKIEKAIKGKDFKLLLQISKDWEVDIYKLKPLELRWKLQQEFNRIKCETVIPTDTWGHFDNYLQFLATQNGIDIIGLETYEQQIEFIEKEFNYPNWKAEKKSIRFWVRQLSSEDFNRNYCNFSNKYRVFDLEYDFEEACDESLLIKQRNDNWMKLLPDLLRTKNCFIAVGYYHLKYKCGLIEQLKNEGFVVEPIELKTRI